MRTFLAILTGMCVMFFTTACDPTSTGSGDSYGAEDTCKGWVKDELKAPSTAHFSNVHGASGSSPWHITGDVDAENSFGAKIRTSWSCDVRLDSDNYFRGGANVNE